MAVVEANLFLVYAQSATAAAAIKKPERNKSAAYKLLLSAFKASINPTPNDLS